MLFAIADRLSVKLEIWELFCSGRLVLGVVY